ncbi:Ig-like domain-containing protein [Hymenobacter lapidiphilus]|uniref:T9SS type A sorting domain-containing protein n=1 Tax=Hymenobacter lapidiphilus TaxID=2608003 RepID=A0A7Y7PR97_9BACT|nr:Ig-like domain-containing protein [Hymenobacter lapidiphilus]NVO32576.1 T9SS type A sorting domain-containing protein [Hymenobacter lapidiphilus]
MRASLIGLALLPALAQAQNVPNVTYQGPITITQGGTYTGNYRSTDSGTPAVTIATSAPVTLQGCVIVGPGDLIQANGVPGDITVLNSQAFGTTPTQDNRYRGRFIAATNAKNIRAENNYLEHTTGFTIYRFSGDGSPSQTVRIIRNKVLDIDGRTRNGGVQLANFIGLNTVRAVGNIEIAWNQVINEPNLSSVEDNINFYNSGGTVQSPARVHDNYVQGAYPFPATSGTYSGTGMTTDGDGTTVSTVPAYLNAFNNQFISTCNAGMNIAAGHDINYYDNRIVTSGFLPDGTALRAVYAGTAVFNGHQVPSSVFYNNSIRNNTIGYRNPAYRIPFPERHDLSNGACATCTGTTHLPNPITLSTEQNEFVLWQQKLQQNNITIGASGTASPPTPPANTAPVVSLSAPGSATVGTALALTATASDADGSVSKVEFFNGATKLGEDLTAPYALSFTPATAGTLSLTARATDNAGAATTSATVALNVTAPVATFYRALNLGGSALTIDGNSWEAAAGASGFSTNASGWSSRGSALNPATDANRADMLTSALFGTGPTLALNVPNGSYGVYLYIWENDSPVTVNVLVEGKTVRSGYSTGNAGHWERLGPFATNVTDGTLNVATTGGNVNLAGLEIYQGSGTASPPTPPANTAPVVSLSAPGSATVGTALALTATASDADGSVSKVEFFNGATKLGEDLTAPYALSFTPATAGTLSLTARATDNAGAATTSATVALNVTAPVATFYRALNLGGSALTIDGNSWEAAAGASGFSTNASGWSSRGSALNPATDANRADMLTSALFGTGPTLALNVPNGSYGVYLYIWENDSPVTVNVLVEGKTVRSGYSTGNAGHWERLGPFATNVTDGTLNVATTGGNVNLAGLEIYQGSGAAGTGTVLAASASSSISLGALRLYPNPTVASMQLQLPVTTAEEVEVGIYTIQGVSLSRQRIVIEPNTPSQPIPTNNLVAGTYILRVLSGSQRGKSLQFVKQ